MDFSDAANDIKQKADQNDLEDKAMEKIKEMREKHENSTDQSDQQ